jgi:benzoyl-CoA reductase subunit C
MKPEDYPGKAEEAADPVIYTTCSYVPEEIIMAAGFLPRRIFPESSHSDAETHIHPKTCCYVKSILADALERKIPFNAEGIVIANSCDGMRKLYDIWAEYVGGARPLFLDIPKTKDPDSISFFTSELRRFAYSLERNFPGSEITDERLQLAISTCNEVRRLMGKIFTLQRDSTPGISGVDVFNWCMQGLNTGPHDFADTLRQIIPDIKESDHQQGGTRIVLTGNVINRPDLISLIESSGGHVVAIDICTGIRHYNNPVDEDSDDPMGALAARYLLKYSCARMDGIEERIQYLKRLASDARADGIIYSSVKYCGTSPYDAAWMRDSFGKEGVPFLYLENDYEWTNLEQTKTQVETFYETIS